MLSGSERLELKIRQFADLLSQGQSLPFALFDKTVLGQVEQLEQLSQKQPSLRDAYRKKCFDLCAFALETNPLLRRLRYKPLGSAGDYEALQKLYLGNSDTFWGHFLQRQEVVKTFQDSFYLLNSLKQIANLKDPKILVISPVYQEVYEVLFAHYRGNPINLYCLDAEPKALQFAKTLLRAKSLKTSYFFERLEQLADSFDFIYAPYGFHCLDEKGFTKGLGLLLERLEPGARLVFYQLLPNHELRSFMEWCLDWPLYYHSEASLQNLCQAPKRRLSMQQQGSWLRLELIKNEH